MSVKVEICVDSIASLYVAAGMGVDRIELCAALGMGGLTPNPGLIEAARGCAVEAHAMIRPRPGDFAFDRPDLDACLFEIAQMRAAGLSGVVLGVAGDDSRLNADALREQIAAAEGMETTLHRVFDIVPDQFEALETAIELGFTRILTSGGQPDAGKGATRIAELVRRAAGRIQIMAGGGVTPQNAATLLRTGVDALHGSCAEATASPQDIGTIGIAPLRLAQPDRIGALQAVATGGQGT